MSIGNTEVEKTLRLLELNSQYRILSEIESMWGKQPSTHRVYIFVNKRMKEVLREIQRLKK